MHQKSLAKLLFWSFTVMVFFTLGSTSAIAQGSIVGVVTDAGTQKPMQGVNIILRGTVLGAPSNAEGRYLISNVPAGTYTVQATFLGYRAEVEEVTVNRGGTVIQDFALSESESSLREVVVSPGHFSIMGQLSGTKLSLSKEDIKSVATFGGDVFRTVSRLPGVIGSDFSSKFSIRGGEQDEILVMFDGMELYDPFHQKDFGGVLSIIPIEAIGGIDLLTGGYSSEYGRKKSGVFNIKANTSPINKGNNTSLGLSFMNARFMSEGAFKSGKGRWLISARRGFVDLALRATGGDDELLPEYFDVLGRVQYNINENHLLSANVLTAGDKLKFVDDNIIDPDLQSANLDDKSSSSYGNTYGWINLQSTFADNMYLQSVLSVGHVDRERDGALFQASTNQRTGVETGQPDLLVDDKRDLTFVGLKQDISYSLFNNMVLKGGIEFKNLSMDYDYFNIFLRQHHIFNNLIRDTTRVNTAPNGNEWGFYLSTRIRPVSPLAIELGGRYDKITYVDDNTISPRVNAAYSFGDNTVLRLGWGQYYQPQGIHELNVQDKEIEFFESERSEHRVLGFEHQFPNSISFRFEAYQKKLSRYRPRYKNLYNTIDVFEETSNDRFRYRPQGGRAKGVEIFFKKVEATRFSWWASYAYGKTQETFVFQTVPKSFDQKHTVDLNANFRPNKKWQFNVAWVFHTGHPYTEIGDVISEDEYSTELEATIYSNPLIQAAPYNEGRLSDYHRLDVRAIRSFQFTSSRLGVFFELINAYDRENIRNTEYTVQQLLITDRPTARRIDHKWIRFLPSIGITWDR